MRGNSVNAQTCSVKTLSLKVGLPGWKRNSSELFPRPKNEERIRIIFLSHPPFLLLRIFLILASNPRASLRIAYVLQREKMGSWKGYLVSAPFHLFDITFEISVPLYWVPNLDPVARARGGDDEEVELTQSPGTGSREKENCLGESASFYRAREDSFCSTPVLHFTVCILPFVRRKSPGTRLLCDDASSFRSFPLLARPVSRDRSNSAFPSADGNSGGGRRNETRKGSVEINGFLEMRRIDFAVRRRKETEFCGAFPRRPIDLLAGNVSIESKRGGHLR